MTAPVGTLRGRLMVEFAAWLVGRANRIEARHHPHLAWNPWTVRRKINP